MYKQADIETDTNISQSEQLTGNSPTNFDKHESSRADNKRALLIIVCTVFVTLSLLAGCFVLYDFKHRPLEVRTIYHGNRVCVPCDMLEDSYSATHDDTISSLCCFSNQSEVTSADVAGAIFRQSQRGSSKNSFHVYYLEGAMPGRSSREHSAPKLSPTTQPVPVTSWITEGETARLGSGISFDPHRGEFKLSASGNYMIYSHISFQPARHILQQRQELGRNNAFIFSHAVYVTHNDGSTNEPLKDQAEVKCPTPDQYEGRLYACHVTNLGAMLWLSKGDVVTLEVAPVEFLLGDFKSTYFGMFLVD